MFYVVTFDTPIDGMSLLLTGLKEMGNPVLSPGRAAAVPV